MPQLVFGRDREIADWVGQQLGISFRGEDVRAIGIVRNGIVICGCVYNHWSDVNVEMSIASTSPRWATREVLRVLFGYPFQQMKLRRVTAVTESPAVCGFLRRLGFEREGTLRDGGRHGNNAQLYGMTRADAARWIGG